MKCRFIKPNKQSCRANCIKDSNFCYRHSPQYKDQAVLASKKGGEKRRLQGNFGNEITLETPNDVKKFLSQVINAVWTGDVPVKVGSSMGFLTRCWLDAYERADLELRIANLENRINQN